MSLGSRIEAKEKRELFNKGIELLKNKKYEEGLKILTDLSNKYYKNIEIILSDIFFKGEIIEHDFEEAFYWLARAVERRNKRAREKYRELYMTWVKMDEKYYEEHKYETETQQKVIPKNNIKIDKPKT